MAGSDGRVEVSVVRVVGWTTLLAVIVAMVTGWHTRPAAAQEGEAQLRVIHASPDAPAVDVLLDGERVFLDATFGTVSEFTSLPAGAYEVAVVPAGEDADEAVATATIDLAADIVYELAVVDFLQSVETVLYTVDASELPEGSARVRAIHLSPDTPPIDIAVADGDVLFSSVDFTTATEYIEVPAGSYDLEVRPAGSEDVAIALPDVELEEGMVYEFLGLGSLEDGTLTVVPVTLEGVVEGATLPEPSADPENPLTDDEGDDAPDDETGVGGETDNTGDDAERAPATGIGVMGREAEVSWLLLALAVALALAGGALRLSPGRDR
jgi:hypothetical protein